MDECILVCYPPPAPSLLHGHWPWPLPVGLHRPQRGDPIPSPIFPHAFNELLNTPVGDVTDALLKHWVNCDDIIWHCTYVRLYVVSVAVVVQVMHWEDSKTEGWSALLKVRTVWYYYYYQCECQHNLGADGCSSTPQKPSSCGSVHIMRVTSIHIHSWK